MAIYNLDRIHEMMEDGNNDGVSSLNEAKTIPLLHKVKTSILKVFPMSKTAKDEVDIKKAMRYYEKENPDCEPLSSFKKKTYTLDSNGSPDKETKNFIDKFGNHAICYEKDGEIKLYCALRKGANGEYEFANGMEDKYKKHVVYYVTAMVQDVGYGTTTTIPWAKKLLEDEVAEKKKAVKEMCNYILRELDEI